MSKNKKESWLSTPIPLSLPGSKLTKEERKLLRERISPKPRCYTDDMEDDDLKENSND